MADQHHANGQVQEEQFSLLIDAVEDYAIFMLSPDGTVQTWNHGAQRIKGYTAEEIVGQHFSVFYVPEEREAGRPQQVLTRAREEGHFSEQAWRMRKDGSRFWADVVITAVHDRSGQLRGFAKITRDLTERRAAEQHQRELLVEQEARRAAEAALLARDRFLSIASHELKTPVASLHLSIDNLMRAQASGRLSEDRLSLGLERMATSSRRLAALVDELLDVSRLTSDRHELETQPTDLAELVRDVADRFAEAEGGDRLTVRTPDSLWLAADASRLDQVLTNLIDNAVKYSEAPAPIEVTVREADGRAEVLVADRGIGLDREATERLFEAFGRGANAESYVGLGLGLYISRQIVERHGGGIEAEPREGGGALFRVWLPIAEDGA